MNKKNLLVLLITLATLSGCADLKAIKEFAAISSDTASYTTLTDDYVSSLERQKVKYNNPDPEIDEKIQKREKQKLGILRLHRLVETYMDGLGTLASDDIIVHDKALDSLASSLKSANIDQKTVDAADGIAKGLAKAATDAYRQHELNKLVAAHNDAFKDIIANIKFIVSAYNSSYDAERTALNTYYNPIFDAAENSKFKDPASIQLLKEARQDKEDTIAKKKQACLIYTDLLDKISKGHQDLYDNRDNLTKQEVLSTFHTYFDDMKSMYKAIEALNK